MTEVTTTHAVRTPPALLYRTDAGVVVADAPAPQLAVQGAEQRNALRSALQSQQLATLSIGALAQGVEQGGQAIADGQDALRDAQRAIDEAVDAGLGDNDLIKDIIALMARLQGSWLDRYAEILGNYVTVFDRITKALNELQFAIRETDDDGNFIVDFSKVIAELARIGQPSLGGNFASHAEAQAFLRELGVEWLEIAPGGPPYQLRMKQQVINDLIAVFANSKSKLTPTEYNSLITSKDNLLERLMHMNRVLPDKNQRMLDLWNTLVKTLSGTIESLNEARTRYVNNLI